MRTKLLFLAAMLAGVALLGAGCITGTASAPGPMGMFRSTDKGETWQPSMALPTAGGVQSIAGVKVYRVYTDPTDNEALYLTSRGQGLFYSYDAGTTWRTVPFFSGKFIYGFAIDPKDKCTIYATDELHIYKTTDCTRTWNNIYTEERPSQRFAGLALDYGNSNLVMAIENDGDLIMSGDAGKSWHTGNRFGKQLSAIMADPMTPGRFYLAMYKDGLMRTDDAGKKWINITNNIGDYSGGLNFYRLLFNPGQKDDIFWISKYGILRSVDGGANWDTLNLLTPPGSVNIYAFAINPKNSKEMYYTGTILGEKNVHVRSTFYKTTDGGKNWVTKKLPTNTIPVFLLVHPDRDNTLFMGFTTLEQ